MVEENKPQLTPDTKPVRVQNPARTTATLVVGLLLGASLGPALFLTADRIELKGDVLLSFAVGAFLTLGVCLMLAAVAALLIVPRIFANARGTLAGMVDDLTQASRAHASGDTDKALDHLGQAVSEGVAWYLVGATRRFAVQAALGLLIAFGGSIGAVLLFSQNALLREQNNKIEKQIDLLGWQNDIADAQKRGAFVTEMFSILQAVASSERPNGELEASLVTRIVVLSTSAVPYRYRSRAQRIGEKYEVVELSPERGQLLLALARMKVKLGPLIEAGTQFDLCDLRHLDVNDVDFSDATLRNCDFSFSRMPRAQFARAKLSGVKFVDCALIETNFNGAALTSVHFQGGSLFAAKFDRANLEYVFVGEGTAVSGASFVDATYKSLMFEKAIAMRPYPGLPKGLSWPSDVTKRIESVGGDSQMEVVEVTFEFLKSPGQ